MLQKFKNDRLYKNKILLNPIIEEEKLQDGEKEINIQGFIHKNDNNKNQTNI